MSISTHDTIMSIVYRPSAAARLSTYDTTLLNALPLDETIPMLLSIFENERDDFSQSRAFDAILSIQGFDRVKFLLDILAKPATDSWSVDWRIACCRNLSRFYDPRAIAALCTVLLEDPDPDTRYVAAESLGVIGDTTAVTALEYARKHDKGKDYEGFAISKMAQEALQQIGRKQTS